MDWLTNSWWPFIIGCGCIVAPIAVLLMVVVLILVLRKKPASE
jgi:hypothetical protein